jgi:Type II CAAX prenyl endopeptidase Rce1-like
VARLGRSWSTGRLRPAVLAARVMEGVWPDLSRFGASTEYPAPPLVGFWVANLLFYGFGEEIGWRGFAQPTLQRRHSALVAAIIVSTIWAAWHLPLFGITATYRAIPAVGFVGFFFSMLTASFLLTWLYLRGRGSILVLAAFHASFDIATTTPSTTKLLPMLMGAADNPGRACGDTESGQGPSHRACGVGTRLTLRREEPSDGPGWSRGRGSPSTRTGAARSADRSRRRAMA